MVTSSTNRCQNQRWYIVEASHSAVLEWYNADAFQSAVLERLNRRDFEGVVDSPK